MKHYKDIILHGAQIIRHLKAGVPVDDVSSLSLAAVRSGARALSSRQTAVAGEGENDDFISSLVLGGNNESQAGADDFLSALGGDELFEQCGIDIDDMMSKALGAYFMYGSGLDLSSPESLKPDDLKPMLLALKEDDEEDCTLAEETEIAEASEKYATCSGLDQVFNDIDDSQMLTVLHNIEESCNALLDDADALEGASDENFDEDSELGKAAKMCVRSLLGDNFLGNLIRYEWLHADKILSCFSDYSKEIPSCIVGGAFPFSLQKKATCLLGTVADVFEEEMCTGIYEGLDTCLPQLNDTPNTEGTIPAACGEDEIPFDLDISVVTQDQLPQFCTKIWEEKGIKAGDFQARFDFYNANRHHGWSPAEDKKDLPQHSELPAVVSLRASNQSAHAQDGSPSTSTSSHAGTAVMSLVLVAGLAISFYLFKKSRNAQSPPSAVRDYSHIGKAFDIA